MKRKKQRPGSDVRRRNARQSLSADDISAALKELMDADLVAVIGLDVHGDKIYKAFKTQEECRAFKSTIEDTR